MESASDVNQPNRELQAVAAALVTLMVTVAPMASVPHLGGGAPLPGVRADVARRAPDLMGAVLAAGFVGAASLAAPLSAEARAIQSVAGPHRPLEPADAVGDGHVDGRRPTSAPP
ncbi:MAG: hypothetical protein ACOX2R_07890 [Anaerolineae bacterium]